MDIGLLSKSRTPSVSLCPQNVQTLDKVPVPTANHWMRLVATVPKRSNAQSSAPTVSETRPETRPEPSLVAITSLGITPPVSVNGKHVDGLAREC